MKPKFLIVDDDPAALDLLATMLGVLDCDVEKVDSGIRALEILHQEKRAAEFDGLLVDLIMPNLSGFGVIDAVRQNKNTATMPIIAVTGRDERDTLLEAYNLGVNYFITKPYTKEQLVYGLDLLFADEKPAETQKVHYTKYGV